MTESLLIHTCCGPCATTAVERTRDEYLVGLFFSNSNIAPVAEYEKRLAHARRLADHFGLELFEDDYDHDSWRAFIAGYEGEPEGGKRCPRCFEYNLVRSARFARTNGFDFFTTTLTVSPHKNSPRIFEIGRELGRFLALDFKQKDGFRRSVELSRELELYRQDYCGCEFSRRTG